MVWKLAASLPASRIVPVTSRASLPLSVIRTARVPAEVCTKVPLMRLVIGMPVPLTPIQPLFSNRFSGPAVAAIRPSMIPVFTITLPKLSAPVRRASATAGARKVPEFSKVP